MEPFYRIQWHLLRLVARVYFRFAIRGEENVPPTGAVLFAVNHNSFLDPPIVAIGLPRQAAFLAKEEMFKFPLFRWWFRSVGVYPVGRHRGDAKAVKLAVRLLKEGNGLALFPEGTRSLDGNLLPFENGLSWLSLKLDAPIVPIYLDGTFNAMPKGNWFPRPYRIVMTIGKPIAPQEKKNIDDFDEALNKLTERLKNEIESMKIEFKRKTGS
ncbi:MAG: lysophospholipid acyltransferase family protein [Candidatus Omnitrophota bacterium]